MSEGGERPQPHSAELQPQRLDRLPIESVQTRELADRNLVAYVSGEIAAMESQQGSIEERATKEHQRSVAGILEDYLTDVQVNLARGLGDSLDFDRSSALRDVSRVHAAYDLLAYTTFTPEREQHEKLAEAWLGLSQEGVSDRRRLKEIGVGVEVTAKQAELLGALAERVNLPYDQSQRFVSAAPLLEAISRQSRPRDPQESSGPLT
jgi:murein L,D-transpeptidase YcbB/YkuD